MVLKGWRILWRFPFNGSFSVRNRSKSQGDHIWWILRMFECFPPLTRWNPLTEAALLHMFGHAFASSTPQEDHGPCMWDLLWVAELSSIASTSHTTKPPHHTPPYFHILILGAFLWGGAMGSTSFSYSFAFLPRATSILIHAYSAFENITLGRSNLKQLIRPSAPPPLVTLAISNSYVLPFLKLKTVAPY